MREDMRFGSDLTTTALPSLFGLPHGHRNDRLPPFEFLPCVFQDTHHLQLRGCEKRQTVAHPPFFFSCIQESDVETQTVPSRIPIKKNSNVSNQVFQTQSVATRSRNVTSNPMSPARRPSPLLTAEVFQVRNLSQIGHGALGFDPNAWRPFPTKFHCLLALRRTRSVFVPNAHFVHQCHGMEEVCLCQDQVGDDHIPDVRRPELLLYLCLL